MARVAGIVSAGLGAGRDFTKEREASKVVEQRIDARANRQERVDTAGLPPDWLTSSAAGFGAGWAFGPVGGLIGAGIAAVLSKRRRAGIAAYMSQDAQSTEATIQRGYAALDAASEEHQGDEAMLAEIEMIRQDAATWEAMTQSPDPQVRGQALVKFAETTGTLDREIEEQQQRVIDASQRERDRLQNQFSTFDNLAGDLRGESQRFTLAREAWQGAQALARNPSPTNDIALIYKMANINDPGAIVTEGDVQVLKSTGSINERMAAFYNSVLRGEAELDETQRNNLIATIDTLYRQQRNEQIDRNERYQAIGRAAQLDPAYQEQLRVPIDPGEAAILAKTANYRPPKPPTVTTDDAGPELVAEEPSIVTRGLSTIVQGAAELGGEVLREARGQTIVTNPETGRKFLREADGTLTEMDATELYESEDGATYRRVDHGGGRFEWQLIEAGPPSDVERLRRASPTHPIRRPTN